MSFDVNKNNERHDRDIIMLTGATNYPSWRHQTGLLLMNKGLEHIIQEQSVTKNKDNEEFIPLYRTKHELPEIPTGEITKEVDLLYQREMYLFKEFKQYEKECRLTKAILLSSISPNDYRRCEELTAGEVWDYLNDVYSTTSLESQSNRLPSFFL